MVARWGKLGLPGVFFVKIEIFSLPGMEKRPGCLVYLGNYPVMWGYFINHDIRDPVINQPVAQVSSRRSIFQPWVREPIFGKGSYFSGKQMWDVKKMMMGIFCCRHFGFLTNKK